MTGSAPGSEHETQTAARRHYQAVIKVNLGDESHKQAQDIAEGIGYACALLMDEHGWTANEILDVLERVGDDVYNEEARRG